MQIPYISSLLVILSLSLGALPFQPAFPGQGGIEISVGGAQAATPNLSFYGSFAVDGKPAVTFDNTLPGVVVEGGFIRAFGNCTFIALRDRAFYGSSKSVKRLGDPGDAELIDLYAIDGSGSGGTIPVTQESSYCFSQFENQLDALYGWQFERQDGFFILPAFGYTGLYRKSSYSSNLTNYLTDFDNGLTKEDLTTWLHGAKLEVGLFKSINGPMWVLLQPSIAYYQSTNTFSAIQNFGSNGIDQFKVDDSKNRRGLESACRLFFGYDYCRWNATLQLFGRYQSSIPGIFNPREDDDGPSRITQKNGTLVGATLSVIYMY